MRSGGSGGILAGIIAVVGIVLFILSRGSVSALFQTIGTIILIVVILAVLAIIALIILAAKSSKDAPQGRSSSSKNRLNEEQTQIINKSRQDLMEIRKQLVTIHNSEIRTKGNAVCTSMDKLFKILKEKPEKIPNTRQFLNYYLPTLAKVLGKYQRLEANGVPAGDMTEKIKSFLEDVDLATNKQCTHLYDDDMLDMTVDMEAMSMSIQREGLVDNNDFAPSGVETVADDFVPKKEPDVNLELNKNEKAEEILAEEKKEEKITLSL